MKIRYLGHSSFQLTDSNGTAVITDPYSPEVGFRMPAAEADAVTISHRHFDHDNISAVGGGPRVVEGEKSCNIGGVEISGIKSYHDDVRGLKRGENVIFKFRMDGVDICHLGDLGEKCSKELLQRIAPVDILLIPVGGNYTIDAAAAKEYADKLAPKIVIPMHYRAQGCRIDIAPLNGFLNLFSSEQVEDGGSSQAEFSAGSLPQDTRVVVLRRG